MNIVNSMNNVMVSENESARSATLKDIVTNIADINRETSAEIRMIYEALTGPELTNTSGECSENRDQKSLLQLLCDEQENAKNNLYKITRIREILW